MFGPFRQSLTMMGGLLWKKPWKMSAPQKTRLRKRMKTVDENIAVLFESLKLPGQESTGYRKIDYLYHELPKEKDMTPRDKYTTFSRTAKGYRKSLHLVPKWTRRSFRENPKFF